MLSLVTDALVRYHLPFFHEGDVHSPAKGGISINPWRTEKISKQSLIQYLIAGEREAISLMSRDCFVPSLAGLAMRDISRVIANDLRQSHRPEGQTSLPTKFLLCLFSSEQFHCYCVIQSFSQKVCDLYLVSTKKLKFLLDLSSWVPYNSIEFDL